MTATQSAPSNDIAAEAQRFKESMAMVAGPVAVVTATADGTPHGTTVSSLASLSMSPAMITVALDNKSALLAIIRKSGVFGVNVLSADQQRAGARFASRDGDRFADTTWEFVDGLPHLPGSSAWLECEVSTEVPAGDHTLILGLVRACSASDAAPLVYSRRTFGTHAELPADEQRRGGDANTTVHTSVVSEIIAREHSRTTALTEQRIEKVATFYDDRLTYTHSNGRRDDKATLLARSTVDGMVYETIDHLIEHVQVIDNVAIATGRLRATVALGERRVEIDSLTSTLWYRPEPAAPWIILHFHSSPAPQETP